MQIIRAVAILPRTEKSHKLCPALPGASHLQLNTKGFAQLRELQFNTNNVLVTLNNL